MILLYWNTGNALHATIAAIMTFVNLVNLFPINPLDGGRMLKSIAYSEKYALAFIITITTSAITAILGVMAGFSLLAYMALIGFFDISEEFGVKEHISKFMTTLSRTAAGFLMFAGARFLVTTDFSDLSNWAGLFFFTSLEIILLWVLLIDMKKSTKERNLSLGYYPLVIFLDFMDGLGQLIRLRLSDIKEIENYTKMNLGKKMFYLFIFLSLVIIHVLVIFDLGFVPGAGLAQEMMK